MTKKEYCSSHPIVATYCNGLFTVKIHGVEHGIEDYIYCVAESLNASSRNCSYHKLKIQYNCTSPYFLLYGCRIPLAECIRI